MGAAAGVYSKTGTTATMWEIHWESCILDYAGAGEAEADAAAVSAGGFADGEGAYEAGVEGTDCE
jgi:hypothetical protein